MIWILNHTADVGFELEEPTLDAPFAEVLERARRDQSRRG
jgi:hypothetical protein